MAPLVATVSYSRWPEMSLPAAVDPARAAGLIVVKGRLLRLRARPRRPLPRSNGMSTSPIRGSLRIWDIAVRQDEMQVAEHPVLGSLREALVAERRSNTHGGERPTHADACDGRRAACANRDRRERDRGQTPTAFTARLRRRRRPRPFAARPPRSIADDLHIIAIAAPAGGYGRYRKGSDMSSFSPPPIPGSTPPSLSRAASTDRVPEVIVHSGFWGCGAFGGDRVLMTIAPAARGGNGRPGRARDARW